MAQIEQKLCPSCGHEVTLRGRRFMDHIPGLRGTPWCRMSGQVAPSKRTYEEQERFHYAGGSP